METVEEMEEGEIPCDEYGNPIESEKDKDDNEESLSDVTMDLEESLSDATLDLDEWDNSGEIADNSNTESPTKFLLHSVRNRRQKKDGTFEYLVEWVGDYENTWEPEAQLVVDGFAKEILLVDTWLGRPPFRNFKSFCKRYLKGKNYIAASTDGRCAFRAVLYACEILQNNSWFLHDLIQTYEVKCTIERVPLTKNGVLSWTIIHDFLKYGNSLCKLPTRKIYLNGFKKNWQTGCVNDVSSLMELLLSVPDGVYICAGYNRRHIGHAFVLHRVNNAWLATDEDNFEKLLSVYLEPWWFGGYFLRRIELLDKI